MDLPQLERRDRPAPSSSAILLVLLVYLVGTSCDWGFLTWWGLTLVTAAGALAHSQE